MISCTNCAASNPDGHKFCGNCGASLNVPITEAEVEQQPLSTGTYTPPHHSITPYDTPSGLESEKVARGKMPLLVAVGSLSLLLVLILMAVLAWSGGLRGTAGPGLTPTANVVSNPSALLEKAREAASNIKTVKYESEAGFFGIDGSGSLLTSTTPLTVSVQGEMELPDNYTLDSNIPQLGDYIGIGSKTWSRKNNVPEWTQQESATLSLGLINPLTLFSYLQYYQSGTPAHVGTEQRGDSTLHRIRFQVDTNSLSLTTNDQSLRSILAVSTVEMEVWIDSKSYLLNSMALAVESADGAGVLLRTYFSDYNGPVNIRPPDTQ